MLTAQLPQSMLCKAKIVATPPWIHYRKKRFKAIFYRKQGFILQDFRFLTKNLKEFTKASKFYQI